MVELNPDMSEEAVRSRLLGDGKVSGLPPHLRPGHLAPDPRPEDPETIAQSGLYALRHAGDGLGET